MITKQIDKQIDKEIKVCKEIIRLTTDSINQNKATINIVFDKLQQLYTEKNRRSLARKPAKITPSMITHGGRAGRLAFGE
jgi:hypothetical protein